MSSLYSQLILLALVFALPAKSFASVMYFAGSSIDSKYAASALFNYNNNTLGITLSNDSLFDVNAPGSVLTALFFDVESALKPVSVSLGAGSTVLYPVNGKSSNPSDGWEYLNLSNDIYGKSSGISAVGFGIFGQSNFSSNHNNLQGISYGLLSKGDKTSTTNGGLKNGTNDPLYKNSLVFTFLTHNGFSLAQLGETVVFQYGSSLSETHVTAYDPDPPVATPEPGTMLLMGIGAVGAIFMKLRRSKAC